MTPLRKSSAAFCFGGLLSFRFCLNLVNLVLLNESLMFLLLSDK